MYYVRCSTRSSGASAKGTPRRALAYISDAHDAERDPSYSRAELAYIARLDPGWKQDLEGGRIALVGLGTLRGCSDQAVLAREFEDACQPFHDRRGSTGYLSYTFTMPKELSLVAEGHPIRARMAMYAAVQSALDAAFPGMEYRAVATVHARNEAGEVHYHAHVLIGKFARDAARGRVYSLNSRSGGNTGKARVEALKRTWKGSLDLELKERLGVVVSQGAAFAKPALTLADGRHVPALNRESRRLLDKHLSFRVAEATGSALAYKIGRLLAKERDAAAVPVPPGFRGCERDVARANARMAAAEVDPPFPVARIQAVSLLDVQRAVGRTREAGLLDDGPGWAVKVATRFAVVRQLMVEIDAELRRGEEMER